MTKIILVNFYCNAKVIKKTSNNVEAAYIDNICSTTGCGTAELGHRV